MQNGTNPAQNAKKIGVLSGFITEVVTSRLMTMTDVELQDHIGNKTNLREQVTTALGIKNPYSFEKEWWGRFYQKYFRFDIDFSIVAIPEKPSYGHAWTLVIIAEGLTPDHVFQNMAAAFNIKCSKYVDDLDESVTRNDRTTTKSYAMWVSFNIDREGTFFIKTLHGKMWPSDIKGGITLVERMIFEMMYFDLNRMHTKGKTFCGGSLNSFGDPIVVSLEKRWFYLHMKIGRRKLFEGLFS